MDENKLGVMETRFAEMIWASAPIRTGDLVKACQEAFGWKRTTTYTMLKRLCQRGIFQNDNGTVLVQIPKEDFHKRQSEQFVADTFAVPCPPLSPLSRKEKHSATRTRTRYSVSLTKAA